jgi:hypothetical protein
VFLEDCGAGRVVKVRWDMGDVEGPGAGVV